MRRQIAARHPIPSQRMKFSGWIICYFRVPVGRARIGQCAGSANWTRLVRSPPPARRVPSPTYALGWPRVSHELVTQSKRRLRTAPGKDDGVRCDPERFAGLSDCRRYPRSLILFTYCDLLPRAAWRAICGTGQTRQPTLASEAPYSWRASRCR
jgi:hypothetical protein